MSDAERHCVKQKQFLVPGSRCDCAVPQEEEMTDEERIFKQERAGGNYGFGTKELQTKNWVRDAPARVLWIPIVDGRMLDC